MKTRAHIAVAALTLSVVLTGCGGNDDEAQAAEAISASMMEESDEDFTVDQAQADCVGEGMVDRVGVDKLKEYGMLTDELTVNDGVTDVTMEEADADSAADVLVNCVDAQAIIAEQMGADDSITPEQQECMAEAFTNEALTDMFSLMFQGKEDEATQGMMEPLMSCMMGS